MCFIAGANGERFIKQVKGDRITPDELKHQLESGERPTSSTCAIRSMCSPIRAPCPARCRSRPKIWSARHGEITRDGEIVLFCT